MVLKPGLPPRSWLVSCTGFTNTVRYILGISRTIQWKEHLTAVELAGHFGIVESIDDRFTYTVSIEMVGTCCSDA